MLAILAAVMLAAAPAQDTIFTTDGGRIVGTVVEETPQSVSIQLPDGTFRRLSRQNVARIQYGDGSASHATPPPTYTPPPPSNLPPPPAYTPPPPPPAYASRPPPPPPYYRPNTGPASPFWASLGLGGMFFTGKVEPGVPADHIFDPQVDINLETGLRLNPHFGLGLYLDVGVGGPGSDVRNFCNANFLDCSSETVKTGVLLRHTFAPSAFVTPWLSLGTGYAYGHVAAASTLYGPSYDVTRYSGWEIARIMTGVDWRTSPVFGVGFYAGVGFTHYTEVRDARGSIALPGGPVATQVEAGLRMTLFP